jgi:hypothetical protein
MSGDVNSLLAHKMRKLVTKYGDSTELADAVRQLMEGERNLRLESMDGGSNNDLPRLAGRPLRIIAEG